MNDEKNAEDQQLDAIVHSLKTYLADPRGQDDFLKNIVDQHGRDLTMKGLAISLPNERHPELFDSYSRALIANTYNRYLVDSDLREVVYLQGNDTPKDENVRRARDQFFASIVSFDKISDDDLVDFLEDNGKKGILVVEAARRIETSNTLAGVIFKKIGDSKKKPGAWLSVSGETAHTTSLIKNLIKKRDGSVGALRLISPRESVLEHLAVVDRIELLQFMMNEIDNPAKSFSGNAAPFLLLTSAIKGLNDCYGSNIKSNHIDCIYKYAESLSANPDQFKDHLLVRSAVKDMLFEGISPFMEPLVKNLLLTKTTSHDFFKLLASITVLNNDTLDLEATKDESPLGIVVKLLDEPNSVIIAAFRSYEANKTIDLDDVEKNVTKSWHLEMLDGMVDVEKVKRLGNKKLNGILVSDELGL